jgi:hypothetical protein
MTWEAMSNVGRTIAIAVILAGASAAASQTRPMISCAPPPPPALAREFHPGGPLAYPTFCAIPVTPTNLPSVATFRGEVINTRLAGAWLQRQTAPDTWTLTGTEDFQAGAIREVAPPPPMTTPEEANTEAFVAKSKAQATPPRKPGKSPKHPARPPG